MKTSLLILALLSFLFAPFVSRAVTVGPVKLEFSVDPGDTVSGELFLQNEESGTKTFYPSFEKFTEDSSGNKNFTKEESDLSTWFKIVSSVKLNSGESRNIPFTISIPKNAPPGGHFAVIWWSTTPPGPSGKQVSIVTRAGILVYLTVSGEVNESAELKNFGANGRILFSLPIDFNLTVKNTGNSYLKPSGEIKIKNIIGKVKVVMPINEFGANILPQSQKGFSASVKDGFFFGLYKGEIDIAYGESNKQNLSKTFWFVVLPWGMISLLIIAIFLIFIVIPRGIKKYNESIIKKAKAQSRSSKK